MNRFTIVLLVALLPGCAAMRTSRVETPAPGSDRAALVAMLDGILRQEAASWDGTPHVWGGVTEQGIDCSGLIQRIYADALGVHLPRTTADQQRSGRSVRRRDLQPGDLVFFTPDGKGRHAGIVLSRDEFVHASSSQGVTTSTLSNPYWKRHYTTARRVLDDRELAEVAHRNRPDGN